ncbi:MAG: thioredoxin family protein [Nitrospirae bacterium]|nr:thioredoxin family protein [Nitrospirota bacterium]
MALLHSEMVPLGSPAHEFTLPGIDGKTDSLNSFHNGKVLVVVFMCNHCPYVKATIHRLIAIQEDYGDRGVRLVGINPNDAASFPEDAFAKMKVYAREWGMNFPYLQDKSQEIARKYKAVCTPDLFVYGPDRTLAYRGRIDDSWQDEGTVARRDLRIALDALLAGKAVPTEQHPAMGCSIKWKG